jgi:hypothetical protein
MVFVTDPRELRREVMTGEGALCLYAHHIALCFFVPNNLTYQQKEVPKQFRDILTPALFSKRALEMYAKARRGCPTFHCKLCDSFPFHGGFPGPYLEDYLREHLEQDLLAFTMRFLSFPFPYFGSGLHRAIQAKLRIVFAGKYRKNAVVRKSGRVSATLDPCYMLVRLPISSYIVSRLFG